MKKERLLPSIIAVATLSLAVNWGCSFRQDTNKPVFIEFWTSDSEQDRIETQQKLAADFSTKFPNIKIKIVGVQEDLMPQRLAAYQAGGRLPEVIRLGLEYSGGYAKSNILDTPAITEVIQHLGEETFFAGPLELMRLESGEYAAAPIDGWVQCLWYRKDWFKQANLEPPTTWDRISKAAGKLNNPKENIYGLVLGTDPQQIYTQQTFEHIALSNNVRILNDVGHITINPDRLKESLKFYQELTAFSPPGNNSWREARKYYLTGRAAMIFYSPYIVDDIAGFADDYRPAKDLAENTNLVSSIKGPHGDMAVYGQIDGLGITRTALPEKRAAAKEWVKYLLTTGHLDVCNMSPGGKVPTRKAIVSSWKKHPYFSLYPSGLPERLALAMEDIKRWGWYNGHHSPIITDLYAQKLFPALIGEILTNRSTIDSAPSWIEERLKNLNTQ